MLALIDSRQEKKEKTVHPKAKTKPQMLKAIEDARSLPGSSPVQYFEGTTKKF